MTTTIEVIGYDGAIEGTVIIKEGSVGHKRCGVSFNPSQHNDVAMIKALAAGLMEYINICNQALAPDDGDGKRCMATAMTHLESAQMFAVKGLFMKPPDTD